LTCCRLHLRDRLFWLQAVFQERLLLGRKCTRSLPHLLARTNTLSIVREPRTLASAWLLAMTAFSLAPGSGASCSSSSHQVSKTMIWKLWEGFPLPSHDGPRRARGRAPKRAREAWVGCPSRSPRRGRSPGPPRDYTPLTQFGGSLPLPTNDRSLMRSAGALRAGRCRAAAVQSEKI